VDFQGEPPETCEPILRDFGFHPLAIQDALQQMHAPKLDDWGQYLYIVMNTLSFRETETSFEPVIDEVDAFLGLNYVVTHHDQPVPALDQTFAACQRDLRHLQDGADHLLYRIFDNLVAGYMPLVERVDLEVDEIEDQVFGNPTPGTVERLFNLKRTLLSMRRILTPQREVLNKLARDDYRVIDPRDRIFFRDIYDHLVRLHDLNESLRDLVSGAMDTYLSVINNRMNEVMKTLTVITTVFMPISFIAGFFGMNYFTPVAPLNAWTSLPTFLATLVILLLIPTTMFLWIRNKRWL
jgi:magnesium transporter